jgi:hypothetical protein
MSDSDDEKAFVASMMTEGDDSVAPPRARKPPRSEYQRVGIDHEAIPVRTDDRHFAVALPPSGGRRTPSAVESSAVSVGTTRRFIVGDAIWVTDGNVMLQVTPDADRVYSLQVAIKAERPVKLRDVDAADITIKRCSPADWKTPVGPALNAMTKLLPPNDEPQYWYSAVPVDRPVVVPMGDTFTNFLPRYFDLPVDRLLSREHTFADLYAGLQKVSKVAQGKEGWDVDKRQVPLLVTCGNPVSGKTAFLQVLMSRGQTRSKQMDPSLHASLLAAMNSGRNPSLPTVKEVVVAFASYNQRSTFASPQDGDVHKWEVHLVGRFLASLCGSASYVPSCPPTNDASPTCVQQLLEQFGPDVGVILCIDETLKGRENDPESLKRLLDTLLAAQQNMLQRGHFVAVLATSLRFIPVAHSTISESGRPLFNVRLVASSRQERKELDLAVVQHLTDLRQGTAIPIKDSDWRVYVNTVRGVLRQTNHMYTWQEVLNWTDLVLTRIPELRGTRLSPPEYTEKVFEFASSSLFGKPKVVNAEDDFDLITKLTTHFEGVFNTSVDVANATSLREVKGVLMLPPIQAVLACTRQYKDARAHEAVKALVTASIVADFGKKWELGTVALLDMVISMYACALGVPRDKVSAGDAVQQLLLADRDGGVSDSESDCGTDSSAEESVEQVDNNDTSGDTNEDGARSGGGVVPEWLKKATPCSSRPSTVLFVDHIEKTDITKAMAGKNPLIVYSNHNNEKAIEGVWTGFVQNKVKIPILFQMKLYTKMRKGEAVAFISAMRKRATDELGLPRSAKLLFVATGLTHRAAGELRYDHPDVWLLSIPELLRLFSTFGMPFASALFDSKAR